MFIKVNEQEQKVLLAALTFYPADQFGTAEALAKRIALHEPPTIGIGINIDGGVVQAVFTDTEGINIECIQVDYDTDGADEDELYWVPAGQEDEALPDSGSLAFVGQHIVNYHPDDMRRYRMGWQRRIDGEAAAKEAKPTNKKRNGE